MRLPELIAIRCQAWLLSSRAALIERRGRVIVGLAQHIAACRAMSLSQSSASGDGADVRFGQTRSFGDVCSMSALLESGRRSAQLRCRKSANRTFGSATAAQEAPEQHANCTAVGCCFIRPRANMAAPVAA